MAVLTLCSAASGDQKVFSRKVKKCSLSGGGR